MYDSSNALTLYGARNGSRCVDVQYDNRKLVLPAHCDGRLVHHAKLLQQNFAVADRIEECCCRILFWISRIYSVHAGRLDDHLRLCLDCAERSGCVGGEVRISGPARENADAPFLEMTKGTPTNEWLRDLFHVDRCQHAGLHTVLLENVLYSERIDHCAEHSHVVAADSIHSLLRELRAADDVTATDDKPDAGAELLHLLDFTGNPVEGREIETESLAAGECFARDLEKYSRI